MYIFFWNKVPGGKPEGKRLWISMCFKYIIIKRPDKERVEWDHMQETSNTSAEDKVMQDVERVQLL